MDQLEVFREQLRRKPGEMQKKEMKKKKDGSDATVKVPAATLRDARVLALWLDEGKKAKPFFHLCRCSGILHRQQVSRSP